MLLVATGSVSDRLLDLHGRIDGLGALAAVRRRGLRVPEDVSIATVHDAPFASYVDPPLTTVRMPLPDMGRVATASLLALIAGGRAEDVMVETPLELIVRTSTGPRQA